MEGNLETTLWMMGPDAIRHYVKYIKSHEDDQRLEKFTNSEDGIEKSVLKWLHHKGRSLKLLFPFPSKIINFSL